MITSPNGKIYIGSTKNVNDRWRYYKNLNCKAQVKLYNSLKKYGSDNHTFEVIWEGDINDMLRYEAILGNWYEVLDKGLNLALPKISDKYKNISQETRNKISTITKRPCPQHQKEKMSQIMMGRKKSPIACRNMGISKSKKVLQYDLNGDFISVWLSAANAARALNIHSSSIFDCITGKSRRGKSFQWRRFPIEGLKKEHLKIERYKNERRKK